MFGRHRLAYTEAMSINSDHPLFDQAPDRYDALIDWPRRLDNEAPFYRHWFQQVDARRVLDAACGTGRHAHMFHEWGLEVEAADLSGSMIAWCRQRYGHYPDLRWVERPYTAPADPPGRFDAVVCVGNSLALNDTTQSIAPALQAMVTSLRPEGVCIVQVLNLWRLPDGPTVWQKCVRTQLAGGDHVLLKSVRRTGDRAFIDLADLELTAAGVSSRFQADTFIGLRADDLAAAAQAAGADHIQFFGNYQRQPYDPATSPDLILVCRRAAG
jgi:glycine/sarcosine N-methyltransferase